MTDIVRINSGNISQFVANAGSGGIQLPKPFEQPIYLVDVHIAGTTHVDGIDELVSRLTIGERLTFLREKDNRFDEMAIKVIDDKGSRLGYIPCDNNEILARLMDGGKLLYGEVTEKQLLGTWNKIEMRVFLED